MTKNDPNRYQLSKFIYYVSIQFDSCQKPSVKLYNSRGISFHDLNAILRNFRKKHENQMKIVNLTAVKVKI